MRTDSAVTLLAFVFLFEVAGRIQGGVVISEFMAAPSERRLTWAEGGVPRLGSGIGWMEPEFDAAGWNTALLPAGYGYTGLSTDLTGLMKNRAPSVYLRKEFTVSEAQAGSQRVLVLSVWCNDGFVAYVNGREAARFNCGPTNHYVFATAPAYNVNSNNVVSEFVVGLANQWLVTGTNILAIQAHNAEIPSSGTDPGRIISHTPTAEFRIDAGLRLSPADPPGEVELIRLGSTGGAWKYFVGRAEPSGGVVDLGIILRGYVPPAGEEDDYDQPSEFSDWLEIQNTGADVVNLDGWSVTDDPAIPAKWRFPVGTALGAGGYLLLLCDDRDEANAPAGPATRLHTNFKLDAGGGYVGLFNNQGQLVDGLTSGYPEQVAHCSFGRPPGDPSGFAYLGVATPGTTNRKPVYAGIVDTPRFQNADGVSMPGGIFLNQTLTLTLSNSTAGSQIRYTLDGSEPIETGGIAYTGPVLLAQSNDKTGIVVRARAFLPGWLASKTKTQSYILRQPTPITNLASMIFTGDPGRDLYLPAGLLAINGGTWATNANNQVWLSSGPTSYNMLFENGTASEREIHLEYYFPPGLYPTNQDSLRTTIGVRSSVSGYSRPRMKLLNVTKGSPWPADFREKPSFNLYFGTEFGPGELDYPLFTNYTTREFKHLRLRAGKNDLSNPFVTDELARRLYLDMGQVGARGRFCNLYLNGVYRGLFNLCERFREPFFQSHFRSQADWDVNYIGGWVDGTNTAFNQLLTTLDSNLDVLANWRVATNRIDIENTADYFLLNIYGATWDWPGNNYVIARERSTGPNSRFRFGMWDAEGAFAAIRADKPPSYNTITSDLLVSSSASLPRIFRRLSTAREFRLYFADRINRHMFNGGVLDDRDPDGAGPRKSHFLNRLDELVREVGAAVQYNSGTALRTNAFVAWADPANGRRSYLLGDVPGRRMFRDSGFWPVTEPPVFSQFGGVLGPGATLSMTSYVATNNQSSTIYFTVDGTDPRLEGGAQNPAAMVYTTPFAISSLVRIKARALNDVTGEWSPLTEALFTPEATAASSHNLVISEIMYHPPDASLAELTAGWTDADDFEFVRLSNIAASPIDLAGVRFTTGITFDFTAGDVRYLNPGAHVLVVANLLAFQVRYGHNLDSLIAGEYVGNLSNGGEALALVSSNSAPLRTLAYSDVAPWPDAADGRGASLILRNPGSNPDHAQPENWIASAIPGGFPSGEPPQQSFAEWRSRAWDLPFSTNSIISGASADPDQDGLCNFLEYAFGLNPQQPIGLRQPVAAIQYVANQPWLALSLRAATGAREAVFVWEWSPDLRQWADASHLLELQSATANPDGTTLFSYLVSPFSLGDPGFIRFRVSGP